MIFHGLLQLLLPLYFSIFPYCMTTQPTNKEGYPLGVGPKATTSLWDAPEVNYLRTSPDAAQTGRTIWNKVDASGYAIRAILIQRDKKGKRHPIAYFSVTLTNAEQNYDIYELEFYAIVRALHHWRQFVAGSTHKIQIYTNHQNLQYWKQPHKIPWRIARQAQEIMEYQLELIHIPEKTNSHADKLSRCPDYNQGDEDNKEAVVLPESMFIRSSHTISYVPEEPPEQNEATMKPWINQYHRKKIRGEWWKDQKKVITQDLDKWRKIIWAYHNLPAYGHLGISRTRHLISKYYWWPTMGKEVYQYVRGCAQCQKNKVNTQAKKAPLNPITPIENALPFQTIAMGFIVKLPPSEGYNSILTITDHDCTKMILTIPCQEVINAEGVANLYLQQVFPCFGLPSKVISDRDPGFVNCWQPKDVADSFRAPHTSSQHRWDSKWSRKHNP